MNTTGLGNALVDVLLRFENDDVLSEIGIQKGVMDMINREQMTAIRTTLVGLPRTQTSRGSVCNMMRSMPSLGVDSGFIGKIGDDPIGGFYKDTLEKAGITSYFIKTDGFTGNCTVMISPDGECTARTFLGPALTITPDEIIEETLSKYQCIYIEGYLLVNEPLVRSTMEKAKKLGLKVALDSSNFNIVSTFKGMLEDIIPKYVDILSFNESGAETFTGQEAAEAVHTLSKLVEASLVTLGKEGALIGSHGQFYSVPAKGGKPADTTGAGGNFVVGFLYSQSIGASLAQSTRIESMLMGYVIDVVGPEILYDKWEQIKLKVKGILAQVAYYFLHLHR